MAITSRVSIHRDMVLVPEMDKSDFESLMESMRLLGQLVPISTYRGEVVDGRARLRACQRLKLEPIFEKIDPNLDPLDVIEHINYRRKHEDKNDISMVIARISDRRRFTREQLKIAGTSQRSVEHAKKVLRDGSPEVIEAVDNKELAVSFGSRLTDLPSKQHQSEAVSKIRQGKKSEVDAELKAIRPVRKKAADERPTVRYSEESQPTAAEAFEVVKRSTDPMEVARLMFEWFEDYQKQIVRGFIHPAIEPPQADRFEQDDYDEEAESEEPTEAEPELIDLETIEIVSDRVSDEMIQSPAMIGLEGRLGSLATAVGAIRLLFAATEKYSPKGDIGKLSDPAITKACGFNGQADLFISALVQEGFLQRDIEHRLLVTDWPNLCLPEMAEELCGTGEGFAEPTGVPKFKEPKAKKVPNKPKPNYTDTFMEFWKAYPANGRSGLEKAWEAWEKAIARATPPEGHGVESWLIQRAKDFSQSEKGKSEFVPAPEVWLNQGRWDDAPEAWTRGSKKEAEKADWTKELRKAPKPLLMT